MMRYLVIMGIIAVTTPVMAQSAGEQALGQRLMQEIQTGLSCSTNLIIVQAELTKAHSRIKELEDKPNKPTDDKK